MIRSKLVGGQPVRPTKDRAIYDKAVSCDAKAKYGTEEEASLNLPRSATVYKCHICTGWHRATKAEIKLANKVRKPIASIVPGRARSTAKRFYGIDLAEALYRSLLKKIRHRSSKPIKILSLQRKWHLVESEGASYYVLYNKSKRSIEEFGPLTGSNERNQNV